MREKLLVFVRGGTVSTGPSRWEQSRQTATVLK
jgi:hypothetical protein